MLTGFAITERKLEERARRRRNGRKKVSSFTLYNIDLLSATADESCLQSREILVRKNSGDETVALPLYLNRIAIGFTCAEFGLAFRWGKVQSELSNRYQGIWHIIIIYNLNASPLSFYLSCPSTYDYA